MEYGEVMGRIRGRQRERGREEMTKKKTGDGKKMIERTRRRKDTQSAMMGNK